MKMFIKLDEFMKRTVIERPPRHWQCSLESVAPRKVTSSLSHTMSHFLHRGTVTTASMIHSTSHTHEECSKMLHDVKTLQTDSLHT